VSPTSFLPLKHLSSGPVSVGASSVTRSLPLGDPKAFANSRHILPPAQRAQDLPGQLPSIALSWGEGEDVWGTDQRNGEREIPVRERTISRRMMELMEKRAEMGKRAYKRVKEIADRSLKLAETLRGRTLAWLVSTNRDD